MCRIGWGKAGNQKSVSEGMKPAQATSTADQGHKSRPEQHERLGGGGKDEALNKISGKLRYLERGRKPWKVGRSRKNPVAFESKKEKGNPIVMARTPDSIKGRAPQKEETLIQETGLQEN